MYVFAQKGTNIQTLNHSHAFLLAQAMWRNRFMYFFTLFRASAERKYLGTSFVLEEMKSDKGYDKR